ncbi:MAG TPA: HutD family protein [Povalibacter sp.]
MTKHLRRHDYVAMPWRNGGGVTYEIAREPQAGTEFTWRLSLALIECSGPFSSFAGYQRAIALVSGDGCLLHGIEQQPVSLRKTGDLKLFPGGVAVACELVRGPCCDLNLMIREPGSIIAARHISLAPGESGPLLAGCDNAVFCLEGELECIDTTSGREIALGLHDTFVMTCDATGSWELRNRGTTRIQLLAFAWRNGDR